MPILGICIRHLPNSITKNIFSVTLSSNYTVFNSANKLAIDAELSFINKTLLKLYIYGLFKLLIIY
jgi:hypothetical protein